MRGYTLDLLGTHQGPTVAIADYGSGALHYQATPFPDGRVRVSGFAHFVPAAAATDVEGSRERRGGGRHGDSNKTLSSPLRPLGVAEKEDDAANGGGAEAAHCRAALLAHTAVVLPMMTYTCCAPLWTGLRPMVPDSLPLVGRLSAVPGVHGCFSGGEGEVEGNFACPQNLYLNCGHGAAG